MSSAREHFYPSNKGVWEYPIFRVLRCKFRWDDMHPSAWQLVFVCSEENLLAWRLLDEICHVQECCCWQWCNRYYCSWYIWSCILVYVRVFGCLVWPSIWAKWAKEKQYLLLLSPIWFFAHNNLLDYLVTEICFVCYLNYIYFYQYFSVSLMLPLR